jgi:hypothetical protein
VKSPGARRYYSVSSKLHHIDTAVLQDLDRRATELARFALFNEQKRTPLRRDEISKKSTLYIVFSYELFRPYLLHLCSVLGADKRTFNAVFEKAQQVLRKTFGMEMVELRTRAAERVAEKDADGKNKSAAGNDSDLEEARNAAGGKKKGISFYILLSQHFSTGNSISLQLLPLARRHISFAQPSTL